MGGSRSAREIGRLIPLDLLGLSAWCGLAAGELEVAARVANRYLSSTHQLYMMTRHFAWLVPAIDLAVFVGVGAVLAASARRWPRRAGWWGPRLIVTLALLPALSLAGPGIYLEARALVAMGIAARVVPAMERHPAAARRWLIRTAPVLAGAVVLQAGWILAAEPIARWRERGRPLPPTGSPDILLIVLDTVRADRLGAYGYGRPTSTHLDRLAARGIRFDEARAPAPWTLASHASFFTGRWPHELGVRWLSPLRGDVPTLAGYLGSLGYATAGFVANAGYCSYDTGLDRGFTHFEDYILWRPASLRTARPVDAAVRVFLEWTGPLDRGWFRPVRAAVGDWFFRDERKSAGRINRDFLEWLDHRREPGRPAFVFLNFLDTHTPYLLPEGARYRFGADPKSRGRFREVLTDWSLLDKQRLPRSYWKLAGDAYDDCLAYLDEQVGALFGELEHRGALDRTLIVITSDHGEGLGEHGLFMHGESLYRTETRVPLVILPPSRGAAGTVVPRAVSLRDLPATIVDLAGLADGAPFPGRSLARYWARPPGEMGAAEAEGVLSEVAAPNPQNPNHGRAPTYRGPMIALAEGDYAYIRNEGDGSEELFNERDDPGEVRNLADEGAMGPLLSRFRDRARGLANAREIRDGQARP